MANMFRFKQFSVDQTGCAMKINTDGVLLGALAHFNKPSFILDIGTGTGVIALMLAQRFPSAQLDAVEIDESAAETAKSNFENSSGQKI
jgi:tRNA1Val (adenine37-N6)-methyltransferase